MRFFKMTLKTRVYLWLHDKFHRLGQWFIGHCDLEEDEK